MLSLLSFGCLGCLINNKVVDALIKGCFCCSLLLWLFDKKEGGCIDNCCLITVVAGYRLCFNVGKYL